MLIHLVQIIGGELDGKPTGFARVSVESSAIKWIGEDGSGARVLFIDQTDIRVTQSRIEVVQAIEGKNEKGNR